MLRFALGLQSTPPNVVLISLSVFLTIFVMSPTLSKIDESAVSPLVAGEISEMEALDSAKIASSEFMIGQTRQEDLSLIYRLSNVLMPTSLEEVHFTKLVPAYLLSELRTAFKIAFVIFLPFLMIDLVVSSILMSLGMIMVPPTTISLPIKVLLFVVLDGWNLITETLVTSVLS
jgi:flagellar biosynthetic protein FliP